MSLIDEVVIPGTVENNLPLSPPFTLPPTLHYVETDTGHKCKHPGYDEFERSSWPSTCAPNKEDWVLTDIENCGDSLAAYPQEFVGCADIAIVPSKPLQHCSWHVGWDSDLTGRVVYSSPVGDPDIQGTIVPQP